jgi:hypothetical protein
MYREMSLQEIKVAERKLISKCSFLEVATAIVHYILMRAITSVQHSIISALD